MADVEYESRHEGVVEKAGETASEPIPGAPLVGLSSSAAPPPAVPEPGVEQSFSDSKGSSFLRLEQQNIPLDSIVVIEQSPNQTLDNDDDSSSSSAEAHAEDNNAKTAGSGNSINNNAYYDSWGGGMQFDDFADLSGGRGGSLHSNLTHGSHRRGGGAAGSLSALTIGEESTSSRLRSHTGTTRRLYAQHHQTTTSSSSTGGDRLAGRYPHRISASSSSSITRSVRNLIGPTSTTIPRSTSSGNRSSVSVDCGVNGTTVMFDPVVSRFGRSRAESNASDFGTNASSMDFPPSALVGAVPVSGNPLSLAGDDRSLAMDRDTIINGLAWFYFHAPKCVLEDLTTHELQKAATTKESRTEEKRILDPDISKHTGKEAATESLSQDEDEEEDRENVEVGTRNEEEDEDDVTGSVSSLSHDATASISKISLDERLNFRPTTTRGLPPELQHSSDDSDDDEYNYRRHRHRYRRRRLQEQAYHQSETTEQQPLSSSASPSRSEQAEPQRQQHNMLSLPFSVKRESALVFVDISGFTRLSRMLDPESVSKIINSYFQMLVDEVDKYRGDVLKFAGDAFFAEWRVANTETTDATYCDETMSMSMRQSTPSIESIAHLRARAHDGIGEKSIADCVLSATLCAAAMVEKYSDFLVTTASDPSISFGEQEGAKDLMLNVHCGVGVGTLVGLHVGDQLKMRYSGYVEFRREFLFLGKSIDQVSNAADVAKDGQVFVSPEALSLLSETCRILETDRLQEKETTFPVCVAERRKTYFKQKVKAAQSLATVNSSESHCSLYDTLIEDCAGLDDAVLSRLYEQLKLYVHPVVRDDNIRFSSSSATTGGPAAALTTSADVPRSLVARASSHKKRSAGSELRPVYIMFIKALISPTLTGDDETDAKLYNKLQSIMHVTSRELVRFRGHLRQFIIDDKGVVLIATFGLRGSTFANMVGDHALPATFQLHNCLKRDLGVENRIGATFGKVYCGVVGGTNRGEFAVMGAAVNLAARLMYSPKNNGILVDEAVQAHADARFAFKSLPSVQAKGYDKPVIIFEPLHAVSHPKKKQTAPHLHIGRRKDVERLENVAKVILEDQSPSQTIMAFIIGESGMGKTALGNCVCESIRRYAQFHSKRLIIARSTSTETDKRIPLSTFRKIFLIAIRELCLYDGTLSSHDERSAGPGRASMIRRGSMAQLKSRRRMSMRTRSPSRTGFGNGRTFGRSDSGNSGNSLPVGTSVPYLKKLCDVCEQLHYPFEFADIVGSQLLSLDGALPTTKVEGRVPSIEEIVDFLTDAYIRLTSFADLIVINLDDFQWIDSLTWKVIRVLCNRGNNIFLIGAMRSKETQALRRMSSVLSWHGEMQSRIIEVPLDPLDLPEIREATSKLLGYSGSVIDDHLCTDIYARTGGLPVYVIELLDAIKRKKMVAIDDSGLLRWTAAAQSEQNRIGQNRVADIELSFLERFDSLDSTVRTILQTCAVLGISFALSDVIRVHQDMDEEDIDRALNSAVDELILVEDIEDEEEDDLSLWSGDSHHGSKESQWNKVPQDRFFQFSHAMWRKSVLDKMLKDQKIELHRQIAISMEKEHLTIIESSDIGRLLTLFDHWKSCADFSKAAPLSLAVGLRLEEWDLSAQSLDVYRDALEMVYESAERREDKGGPNNENELWLHASAPTTTLEFILRLHIRIAKCHARLGEQEQCATAYEDAYRIMATSTEASRFNQDLLIPILSGLCSITIQRGYYDDEINSDEMIQQFVAESRKHPDKFHLCRAIAMEAYRYARNGDFVSALVSAEELKKVYQVEEHAASIREEYGKDYAAQCLTESTQWCWLTEDVDRTMEQVDFVVSEILPHLHPGDIDAVMECTFPVLMVLMQVNRSDDAEAILFNNVINPFHDFGGTNSFWLKFFNPLAYLLEVIKMEEMNIYDFEMLDEIEIWAVDGENSIFSSDLQKKGNVVVGEICCKLVYIRLTQNNDEMIVADELMERARMLLARVVFARDDDQTDRFLVDRARRLYNTLEELFEDDDDDDSEDEFATDIGPTTDPNHFSRRREAKVVDDTDDSNHVSTDYGDASNMHNNSIMEDIPTDTDSTQHARNGASPPETNVESPMPEAKQNGADSPVATGRTSSSGRVSLKRKYIIPQGVESTCQCTIQ